MPLHQSRIVLPQGTTVTDVGLSLGSGEVIGSGVSLMAASQPVPVGQAFDGEYELVGEAFPGDQAVRWAVEYVRGYTILDLSLFPVSYAAGDGTVSFYRDIDLTLTAAEAGGEGVAAFRNDQGDRQYVAALVDNDSALDEYQTTSGDTEAPAGVDAEYLIITSDALATSMQALADHRAAFDGYTTQVLTLGTIESTYSGLRPDGGTDLQTSIRNCIIDYYTNHGTQFVVLGGDSNIVPDRNTHVETGSYSDSSMPTDLYYAGLDGDWDGDTAGDPDGEAADGVYGEVLSYAVTEGDLYPEVHVGRIPVRTAQQATDYIDKVIDYDLNPPIDLAGKFLLGGKKLGDSYSGSDRPSDLLYDGHVQFEDASHSTVSDAEMWQRRAYRNYVQNDRDWDGQVDNNGSFAGKGWQAEQLGIVTDTLTSWDASSPGDYRIDDAGLSAAFNEGWNFLIFDTHGGKTVWASEGTYFNSGDALALTGMTNFVYTGACDTNAFDKTDNALSEAFLRSASGGALAYIGSSRYGWYSPDSPPASNYSTGGTSSNYQARWLEQVFLEGKTLLGEAFDGHKEYYASSAKSNGSARWLQMGLNLMGDPALRIIGVEPVVSIEAADPYAAEGSDSGEIVISRSGNTADDLTVQYARSGSATYGKHDDYETSPASGETGSITIPAGSSSVAITVDVVDDSLVETDETVSFALVDADGYMVSSTDPTVVTVVDNDNADTPTVEMVALDDAAAEQGSDPATLRIWRTGSAAGDLTVSYSLGGTVSAGDYSETLTGSLVLPAGVASTDVVITPVDDVLVEGDETLTVSLQASAAYTIGSEANAAVSFAENESPHVVSVSAADGQATENPADPGVFRISRTGDTSLDLSVEFAVSGTATAGNDYAAVTSPVTIPAGSASVDVPVDPLDDSEYESPETIVLTVQEGSGYYEVRADASATVTLADDDNAVPVVSLLSPADGFACESGDLVTLQASATDDFGIGRVEFYADGNLIGQGTDDGNDVYSLDWVGQYGSVSLTAVAVDTHGATTETPGHVVTGSAIPDGSGSGILRQWWTGISGTNVADLTGSAAYPDSPSGEDIPAGPDGVMEYNPETSVDNYGTRLRGWFLAPKTGAYTFYVCSDDSSELWLSTSASPDDAALIASVSGYASYDQWDKFDSQSSSEVQLLAGQRYYIDALHKEGSGGDHIQVGVSLPGGQLERSIPYHRLMPWVDSAVVVDAAEISIDEGGVAQLGVKLSADPGQAVDMTVARTSGDADLSVTAGASLTFDSSSWDTWKYATLAAAQDADSTHDSAVFAASATDWTAATVTATEIDDDVVEPPTVQIDSPTVSGVYMADTASMLVLEATVSLDGSEAGLTQSWTVAAQPAGSTVVFENPDAADTVASFSDAGEYTLVLTGANGGMTASESLTVTIGQPSSGGPDPDVLWWKFDETAGTLAADATGQGRDGDVIDATWATGQRNGALSFDGSLDYVLDDDGENYINGLDAFTLTTWIKPDRAGVDMGWLIARDPTNGDDVFGIRYDQVGASGGASSCIKAGITTTEGVHQIESSANIQTTDWQFVALTWSAGGSMTLYLDGSVADALTHDSGPIGGTITGATKLLVGRPPKGDDWDGLIDDVRLYGSELTPAEIQAIYDGAPANVAAQVSAGSSGGLAGNPLALAGTVSDDGQVLPVTTAWLLADGPAGATFDDATSLGTGVTVDQPGGTYTFRLVADDGQVKTASDVTVDVAPAGDLDLDGQSTFLEVARTVAQIGRTPAAWADGDAFGDGTVDVADADAAVLAYLDQRNPAPATVAEEAGGPARSPEPTQGGEDMAGPTGAVRSGVSQPTAAERSLRRGIDGQRRRKPRTHRSDSRPELAKLRADVPVADATGEMRVDAIPGWMPADDPGRQGRLPAGDAAVDVLDLLAVKLRLLD